MTSGAAQVRWLALLLLLAGCEETRTVTLSLWSSPSGAPSGFDCICSSGESGRTRRTVETAYCAANPSCNVEDVVEVTLCVDFLVWDGGEVPGCRVHDLLDFCGEREGRCLPEEGWRVCRAVSLSLGEAGRMDVGQRFRSAIGEAFGEEDPLVLPSRPGILRVVGTFQTPEDALAGYDPPVVFGCAYSCPADFRSVGSRARLGLDSIVGCKQTDVAFCAFFEDVAPRLRNDELGGVIESFVDTASCGEDGT